MKMADYYILFSTIDDKNGEKIAKRIIEKKLAACVSIIPNITSIYRWEGKIVKDSEKLLIIKTTAQKLDELRHFIKEHHPYELPEFIAVPIEYGLPEYFMWLSKNTE